MNPFLRLCRQIAALFRKARLDGDMNEEMRTHIELRTQRNIEAGMNPEDARNAALRKFGWTESIKEDCRDQRGVLWLENLVQDLRFGIRQLLKSPGFTLIAVLTLALGIGIDTSIFTIINAAAFRPLPILDSGRIVSVFQGFESKDGLNRRNTYGGATRVSYSEYRAYRDQNLALAGLIAYAPTVSAILGGENPQLITGTLVSGNYFSVLKVAPILGRVLTDTDCTEPDANAVVVLSHDLWQRAFSGDAAIIGKSITLNRTPYVVVGVAGPEFGGTELVPSGYWAPLTMQRSLIRDADALRDDHTAWLVLMGRMNAGISMREVQAELEVIAARIDRSQPGRITTLKVEKTTLAPAPDHRGPVLLAGAAILGLSALVLVIACANIANLLLSRTARRRKEIAVRMAVGATRWRLVRQFLVESLLLASLGGVLGMVIAFWSSTIIVQAVQSHLPHGVPQFVIEAVPDARVLAYALFLILVAGLTFGLIPALRATRANLDPVPKDTSAESQSQTRHTGVYRNGLIVLQVAACMVLLLITGLLVRGLQRAQTIDPGFESKNIALASINLSAAGYDNQRSVTFQRQLLERVAAIPGVDIAAQAGAAPLSDRHFGDLFTTPQQQESRPAEYNIISSDYFSLLKITFLKGRNFTYAETHSGAPVAIVSESTARQFWPRQDPIGKTLRKGARRADAVDLEIIGVVRDAQVSHLGESDKPFVYLPIGPNDQLDIQLIVHTLGTHASLEAGIRHAVRALDSGLAIDVVRLEDNFDTFKFPGRVIASLSGVLGALALLLALIGLYGVVSYAVSRRVREIGIRMALGASHLDVVSMIVRQSMRPVTIGVGIGILACAAVSNLLSSVLFGLSARDPISFVLVPVFLLAAALMASFLPARRAARISPIEALRCE